MSRLALGTVQFGLAYGVTNTRGQVSLTTAHQILKLATQYGIDMLDTAAAYGQSEAVLGQLEAAKHFQLVSKTLPLSGQSSGLAAVLQSIENSLAKLAVRQPLYGILIHQAHDLRSQHGRKIYAMLQKMKDAGHIKKIGVSVYSAEELEIICQQFKIDLVQLPHNILDQRLRQSGHLQFLQEQGIEIHIRSAFLQGLLLENTTLPKHLQELNPALQRFHNRAKELGCSALILALAYLRQQQTISRVLVGVLDTVQLTEICTGWEQAAALPANCADDLSINNEMLLNPAKWALLKAIT